MDLGRVPVLNLVILALLVIVQSTSGIQLVAVLSRHGIKGNVTFEQSAPGSDVTVGVHLTHVGTDAPPPEPLEFAIYSNPVDYSTKDICRGLGDDVLVDLAKYLGSKSLFDSQTFTISPTSEPNVEILGESGTIWGRSVRVTTKTGPKVDACGSIHADHLKDSIAGHDDEGSVTGIKTKVVRARFRHPLGGSVWFRAVDFGVRGAATHTLIYSDLYDVSNAGADATRKYPWALYATEPRFAREDDAAGDNCKNLLNVFDPEGKTARSSSCSKDKPEECALGELHARHGELEIGNLHARFSKKQAVDAKLALPELGARVLYLVIRDPVDSKGFYACAKLTPSPARNVTAEFNSKGVLGSIAVVQHSPFEPSKLIPQLWGLDSQAGGFHVHEYPVPPPMSKFSKVCGETGGHFNPFKVDFPKSPAAGAGTHDEYELGDLSGKHGLLINVDNVNGSEWDTMLPLWGPQSVSGRSIVVHKHPDKSRWVCATLVDSRPTIRAVVTFKYPFVGTVEFRQAEEDPDSETTIFIDSLVYADLQTVEDTGDHKWHVHVKPPDSFQDSINWQKRCTSAGGNYNPFQIPVNESSYDNCSPESPEYCEVGDLAKRLGTLKIVHDKARRNITRFFFTDTYLPLSGRHSVVDRSIVIHAEEHLNRGNRLACAKILKTFRHKGVVREWGTDDDPDRRAIGGSIEFTQDARYDATNVKVDFNSLLKLAGGYHVHVASVEIENRFPCQTTGPHWNPFQVPSSASQTPPGSLATVDKFEIGDLNGKHGKLDNLESLKTTYSDLNLPMYGNTSIMGRSVVVHKLEKGARWSCGSIEWGYSPSEATQRSAIASFHHPNGFVRGYIRFRQVIYNNGFESETFIEVNLNHVGENKNKQSHGHNWAIFNSLAGSDTAVKEQTARCSSAGNRWNPTTVDSTKREKYESQCGQDLPFRCEVGDMSGKLGPISIGDGRQVFSDPHYPLSGRDNGMLVKSVVIYDENGSALRFACAQIEPDDDVIRTVSMQKSASYSQSQFMREVREILGAPDWLVVSDVGKSKDLHDGECEQLTLRFMGPKANQLSDDFAKLLASGSLPTPTMAVPGLSFSSKRNLSYKPCRQTGPQGAARQENNAGASLRLATASVSIAGSVAVILAARVALPAYLLG